MDYSFWYDVAEYGNENWKGGFTPREVAENAYVYLLEWQMSLMNRKATYQLKSLIELLREDMRNGSEKALELSNTICDALTDYNIKWFID